MHKKFLEILTSLGIGHKESQLYLILLELGAQPASSLARRLSVPRSSAQFLAETLVKRRFASKVLKGGVTFYQPEHPVNLMQVLEMERSQYLSEFRNRRDKLAEITQDLASLSKAELGRPRVTFLEGIEGIRTVYEDALTAQEPIRTLSAFDARDDLLPGYFEKYYKRRVKKNVKVQAIYSSTPRGEAAAATGGELLRESKLVDSEKYGWEPEIQFYDNKVAIASGRDKVGIIIESREVADAMKVLFDLAWAGIQPMKKKKKAPKKK